MVDGLFFWLYNHEMKIRVKIPEEYMRSSDSQQRFIDDVLIWGMETEMDIELYTVYRDSGSTWNKPILWAIFTVEADYSYMFSLKWGAVLHKKKKE